MDAIRMKLAAFRTSTKAVAPYLSGYVYGLIAVERPGIGTLALSDDGRLYFDPEFVAKASLETGRFVVLHETLHLILGHAALARKTLGDNPTSAMLKAWGTAADLVCNQILGHWLEDAPAGVVTHDHFGFPAGETVVRYYYRLLQEQDEQQNEEESGDHHGAGSEGGQGDDSGGGQDPQPNGGGGTPEQRGGNGGPDGQTSGSCADGQPRSYELPRDRSWADREYSITSELETAIAGHEDSQPGTVPGALKAAVELRLRPQPDPFDSLTAAVSMATSSPLGMPDFTLRRFSRRQQADGPRLRGVIHQVPSAVVILDTSASMGLWDEHSEHRKRAFACIAKGLARLRSVKVICADVNVQSRQLVGSLRSVRLAGNGGTAMDRVIEQVDREDRPTAIILLSDGETRYPKTKPRARVVVGLTQRNDHWPTPEWAKVVLLASTGGVR